MRGRLVPRCAAFTRENVKMPIGRIMGIVLYVEVLACIYKSRYRTATKMHDLRAFTVLHVYDAEMIAFDAISC